MYKKLGLLCLTLYCINIPLSAAHYGERHSMRYADYNYGCNGDSCLMAQNNPYNGHRRGYHNNMMNDTRGNNFYNDAPAQNGNNGNNFFVDSTSQPNVISVKDAVAAKDDTVVILKGNLVKRIDDDKFTFKDASGTVTIEIDDDIVNRMSNAYITPEDEIIVEGKLDKELLGKKVKVEVYRLDILNRNGMRY